MRWPGRASLPQPWLRDNGIFGNAGPLPTGCYAFLQTRDDGWTRAVAFNRMPDPVDIAAAVAELEAAVIGATSGKQAGCAFS